jgi:hypothetical protein
MRPDSTGQAAQGDPCARGAPARAPSPSPAPLYINASDLASLLGSHPFQCTSGAWLDALSRMPAWRLVVREARRSCGVGAALIAATAALASSSGAAAALAEDVAACTVAAAAATTDAAVGAAVARAAAAAAAASTLVGATSEGAAALVAAAARAVATARGSALEAAVLDDFEAATGAAVGARNDAMVYARGAGWVVGGRVDGFDAATGTVVEAKNRMRARAPHRRDAPPLHDLLQLRAYVAALRESGVPHARGVLLERFPDGSSHATPLAHCERTWAQVAAALERVAADFRAMTPEDVFQLARLEAEHEARGTCGGACVFAADGPRLLS